MASLPTAFEKGIDVTSLLVPGEDRSGLETLTAEYTAEYQPATPTERHYVHRLIVCDWLRRRYYRMQAEIVSASPEPERPGDALVKLFDQIDGNDRTYDQARQILDRLRTGGSRQPSDPEPDSTRPILRLVPRRPAPIPVNTPA